MTEQELVDQMRATYPDLNEGEEEAIRNHHRTWHPLFLRCTFNSDGWPVPKRRPSNRKSRAGPRSCLHGDRSKLYPMVNERSFGWSVAR